MGHQVRYRLIVRGMRPFLKTPYGTAWRAEDETNLTSFNPYGWSWPTLPDLRMISNSMTPLLRPATKCRPPSMTSLAPLW